MYNVIKTSVYRSIFCFQTDLYLVAANVSCIGIRFPAPHSFYHSFFQHSMAFQTPIANTDVYKGSFFPQTIRDWNALPDSLISSAEDAEDCVAKFTSLVRARD